jgi:hypothetical protein
MKTTGLSDSPFFSQSNAQPGQINDQADMPPQQHASMVASIRKALRSTGKEAATYRITKQEKGALIDLIYAYRRQNMRVSENEIARIAINFLIQDYKANHDQSLLDEVLRALNE